MAATDLDKLVLYRRSDDRELVPLASPTTIMGANASGIASGGPFALGFSFNFDGVAYTSVDVFSYGFLRLAGGENSTSNGNLYTANASQLIAPWWDSLKTADGVGYIKLETQGTAPWRRCVIEWYASLNSAHTALNYERGRFQCILHETRDAIEWRYGVLETGGTPARGSYSASCGVKSDTTLVGSNYRDASVDGLPLGGSNTSATSTLVAPAAWPTSTIIMEPAWPMCGRAFLLDVEQLAGLQDPYAEPCWRIANFVNWMICNFRPALVNISPWQETMYTDVDYVVPVNPSADGLTYDVYVQTYTTSGGDQRVSIDEDKGVMPFPGTDAHWNNLHTEDALATTAGWREWTAFQITPSTSARALRISASHLVGANVILGSVLVVPQSLADIDELATLASGAVPLSIAQFRQEGGAIHPEFYNRARATIRALLRDRRQMVWSSIWPDSSKKTIDATTARPQRMIGVAPAALPWSGQRVSVNVFATTEVGATIDVAEEGGSSVSFDVHVSGTLYTLQEAELELVSDLPTISCAASPLGPLSPMAITLEWAPDIGAFDLIPGITPAPKLEYLLALAALFEQALSAYAMTGLATALCRGKSTTNPTRAQWQVPPATKRLQPRVVRVTADTGNGSDETTIYGVSSGTTAQEQIVLEPPTSTGRDDYPPEGATAIIQSAMVFEDVPTAAMDRLLESPTIGSMSGPARERLEIVRGSGITLVPIRDDAGGL